MRIHQYKPPMFEIALDFTHPSVVDMSTPVATTGAEAEAGCGGPALSVLIVQLLLPRCHEHKERRLRKEQAEREKKKLTLCSPFSETVVMLMF